MYVGYGMNKITEQFWLLFIVACSLFFIGGMTTHREYEIFGFTVSWVDEFFYSSGMFVFFVLSIARWWERWRVLIDYFVENSRFNYEVKAKIKTEFDLKSESDVDMKS